MAAQEEEDTMPMVYRMTAPFAKMTIRSLGFDRRRRDTKVYEYAIHRFYMDIMGIISALLIISIRLYLAFDVGQPYSGMFPLQGSDVLLFWITIITLLKNWQLLKDYRKNVFDRIKAIAKNR